MWRNKSIKQLLQEIVQLLEQVVKLLTPVPKATKLNINFGVPKHK